MSRLYRTVNLIFTTLFTVFLLLSTTATAQVTTFTLDTGTQTGDEQQSKAYPFASSTSCKHNCDGTCLKSGCSHSCKGSTSCNEPKPTADLNITFDNGVVADESTPNKCTECENCNNMGPEFENSDFSSQVAELLRVALKNKNLDDPNSRKVIENAMALVVRNAQTEANAQVAKMKVEHEKELALFRGQLVQMSAKMNATEDFKNWMGPLYTNQNRTMQQIQMLAYSSNTANRTLSLLEKQMSTKDSIGSTQAKYNNRPGAGDRVDSKVYDLTRQVNELQRQLRQFQTRDVQPANHLQPIFDEKQPEPLDIPWPSEEPWGHKQFRR